MRKFFDQYRGLLKTLATYYRFYGGFATFALSPLMHIACLITIFTNLYRVSDFWIRFVEGAFPTILGFSLAAYTMIFGIISNLIPIESDTADDVERKKEALGRVNATFFHAIFWQTLLLIYSLLFNFNFLQTFLSNITIFEYDGAILFRKIFYLSMIVGNFLLFYSILLMFSLLLGVFRLANMSIKRA